MIKSHSPVNSDSLLFSKKRAKFILCLKDKPRFIFFTRQLNKLVLHNQKCELKLEKKKKKRTSYPILEFKFQVVNFSNFKMQIYTINTQIFTHINSLACKHNHITLHMEMIFLYLT